MKRVILIVMTILIGALSASAQDVIVKKSGDTVKAKISYVGPDTIIYKLYDEQSGAEYEILKSDVSVIHYESGRAEVIDSTRSSYDALLYGNRPEVAGIVPGMKYKELKNIYDYRDYIPGLVQTYSPAWSGVASWVIPGLGQMVCGSVGRGFAYLGGYAGCYLVTVFGAVLSYDTAFGGIMALAGCAGMLTVNICSIVDAVRMAKVKNMYMNDLRRKYSFELDLYPSVNYVQTGSSLQPAAGLTLALKF